MNTTPQAARNETVVSFRLKSGEMEEGRGRESGVDGAAAEHDGSGPFPEAISSFSVWTDSSLLTETSIISSLKECLIVVE